MVVAEWNPTLRTNKPTGIVSYTLTGIVLDLAEQQFMPSQGSEIDLFNGDTQV